MWFLKTTTVIQKVEALGMIQEGTYKHINKTANISSLFKIQNIAFCETVECERKDIRGRKNRKHTITTFPHLRSWIKLQQMIVYYGKKRKNVNNNDLNNNNNNNYNNGWRW